MNSKHQKTFAAVFAKPALANLEWARIEALFTALGCKTIEGNGSRVRFVYEQKVGTFHRPHPAKEAKPYQVDSARKFLILIGVAP